MASLRARAIRLLARREHSRAELRRKLEGRRPDPEARALVEETLSRLEGEGLLSEERFLESFVRSRIGRGQGPLRIRRALGERGIEGAVIESALGGAGLDWVALARVERRRRFGDEPPSGREQWLRQARHLAARGFTEEQVRQALREPEE